MRAKNLSMSLFAWAFFAAKAVETPLVSLNFDGSEQTLEGGVAHSSARVSGVRGEAVWFWGEQEQGITATGADGIAPTEEMTVAAWVWLQRFGDHQTILWKGDRSRAIQQVNFRLAVRPEGTLEFSFKGPADEWYDFASPAPVPLHRWVHVAASFNRGKAALEIGGVCVREGRMHMYTGKGKPPAWAGDAMPTNTAPLEIGAGQGPSGEPGQFFCGALDEVAVWPTARALPIPDPAVPDARSPLESLLLFERSFSAEEFRAKPWLCGRVGDGRVPWVLSVRFPDSKRREILAHGTNEPDGTFRRLFDDYCGPFDLRGASNVNVRIYRNGGPAGRAVPSEASLQPDADSAHIEVETEKPLQRIRGFGCYADFPKSFLSDPEAREREYAPFLDALKEIGVTRLDFSLQLQRFEPRNDDGDPRHINWELFRKTFASEKEYRTVIGYLAYVQSKGFSVGLRVMGYPDWQWIGQGHGRHPDSNEVAEMCVAWVTLLREEGVFPTHLVPLWEPPYSPENVADICAKTARLMRQNKIDVQVVGPYRYATGGQSMDMDAMTDRYLEGKRYVGAYLRAMGDLATAIGVEDYSSGWAMAEPNLKRLWREVIEPLTPAGTARELWMLEYGPSCGLGPWTFYPSRWHGSYAGYESAFRLARMLHQQFNGGVNNFFFWKAYDGVGDADLISSCGLIKNSRQDCEWRPLCFSARVLWKHVPPGARHLACTANSGLLANAFVKDGKFTVHLTNPRSTPIPATIRFEKAALAPQAFLYSSTENVTYQECPLDARGNTVSVTLSPRSVNALVCRTAHVATPFSQTVWPHASATDVYLSDLQWSAVSAGGKRELSREAINGMNVDVHQDETATYDWLTLNGIRYRKGLGTRTPSEVVYELDKGVTSFEATLGIDDATRASATNKGAIFTVSLDGKTVFTSEPVKRGENGRKVHVPCADAKELRLTVSGDEPVLADWAEARLRR